MNLFIDLSEFLSNPIRTGIQRIAGELCRYLPQDTFTPIRLSSTGYRSLPTQLIAAISSYFSDSGTQGVAEILRLGAIENSSTVHLSDKDTVLVPEVFDNPQRLAYFKGKTDQELERFRFIVYDLLPMTHPEYFSAAGTVPIYGYYHLLRRAPRCGFISEFTRNAYYERLKRTHNGGGIVLPLGCDALGARVEKPPLKPAPTFSVLGTVEPRKNHEMILDAFEPLFRSVKGLTLSFIGRMGWVSSALGERVRALASDPDSGFKFLSSLDDRAIRKKIEESRATIYISSAEGFGLPPVESLWVGTPVIASAFVPSLERLGSHGVHYVQPLDVATLRRAVLSFLSEQYWNVKVDEACSADLPTWHSFAQKVLAWCSTS